MADAALRLVGGRSYVPAERTPVLEGAVPPHDLDAEAAVLSALLLEPERLPEVRDLLPPVEDHKDAHFFSDANRVVYAAIIALADADEPIDVVKVASYLRKRKLIQRIGGAQYLGQLVDATPAVAHVRSHAEDVRDCAIQRAYIRLQWKGLAEAYGDVGDRQAWREQQLRHCELVVERGARLHSMSLRDALYAATKELDQAGGVPLLRTGLRGWDSMAGGLYLGKSAGLIAEWGEGKTSLALRLCWGATGRFEYDPELRRTVLRRREVMGRKVRGLVIGVEMDPGEQSERVAQQLGKSDRTPLLKGGNMSSEAWGAFVEGSSLAAQLKIEFIQRDRVTTSELINMMGLHAAKALREGEILGPVVLDHLHDFSLADEQRRNPRGDRRIWLCDAIKRLIKGAKKHYVALLLVCQGNKRQGIFESPGSGQAFDYLCSLGKPDKHEQGSRLRELTFKKLRNLGEKNQVSEVYYHGGAFLFSDEQYERIV